MPLLQFDPEKHGNIGSFRELYDVALCMLTGVEGMKTIVLGPVTSEDPDIMEDNISVLRYQAQRLSQVWNVLDLTSFQQIILDLIEKSGVKGYPHVLLEEFTIPLIKSGLFKILFVRKGYENSTDASLEHEMALSNDIHVFYFE